MSERGYVIDRANDRAMQIDEAVDAEIRYQASLIPVGEPVDCSKCGEWSGRIVFGACATCIDKYRLH